MSIGLNFLHYLDFSRWVLIENGLEGIRNVDFLARLLITKVGSLTVYIVSRSVPSDPC